MITMKNRFCRLFAAAIIVCMAAISSAEDTFIKISTTSSTEASGLLDVLLPEFEKDTGIQVKVIAKGTGAAIRDGRDGNVDIIFVHAKNREEQFVSDGYGTKRYPVMHNDFIIVGPHHDPANIKGLKDAVLALHQIAESKSRFVSRGDDSGTHTKEQLLWADSDIPLKKELKKIIKKGQPHQTTYTHPGNSDKWYLSVGQGMGTTLTIAAEKQAYALTDRGTYLKYKLGREMGLELEILCEGDPKLANPYGIIPVNPDKFAHVNYKPALKFVDWITSTRGQTLIANYRLCGKQLFFPYAMSSP